MNQYTTVAGVVRTYDTKGNLTGDNGNTYGYDVESRLKTFSKTGTTAAYAYDAFNRRVSKTVNGTATFYVYDGDDIIEERNSAGTLVADYVHGDQTDEPLTMTRGGTTYYYFADGLGSVRQLTNSAGAVQQTYDYNSYGKLAAAPTVVNPFTYTGREYDVESGNYYYRARYYNPTLGRFLQRDPIGYMDGMNLYAYVHNSPANFTDPTGMFWWLAAVEGVLFLYDSYGLYMTLTDPCASNVEKTVATAAWVAGATSFGGGTVMAARRTAKELDTFVDLTTAERRNHILKGDLVGGGGGHKYGTGRPGKSEFPKSWSDNKIMHMISDVATDPKAVRTAARGGNTAVEATREGVNIRVILGKKGDIRTGYPTNVKRNP